MTQRFDITAVAADGYKAMLGIHAHVDQSGLDRGLLELVRLRASQINGCAFCLAMHAPLARRHGVTDTQLDLLAAWREAPVFDARTQAALAWTETLTRLPGGEVPDELYGRVAEHFTVEEIANLSFAVVEINAWNRLMIASRTPPQSGA